MTLGWLAVDVGKGQVFIPLFSWAGDSITILLVAAMYSIDGFESILIFISGTRGVRVRADFVPMQARRQHGDDGRRAEPDRRKLQL